MGRIILGDIESYISHRRDVSRCSRDYHKYVTFRGEGRLKIGLVQGSKIALDLVIRHKMRK